MCVVSYSELTCMPQASTLGPATQHPHTPTGPAPAADKAAACCDAALADQQPSRAAATALAALSLASCLRFGGPQSAQPYAEAAVRCKQALKAAYDAGAEITQEVSQLVLCTLMCARTHLCTNPPWAARLYEFHTPLCIRDCVGLRCAELHECTQLPLCTA